MPPILVHFHFHRRRTGVTRSVENVLPGLAKFFETYIFGYGIEGFKIGLGKMLGLIFSRTYFVLHAHRNNELMLALLFRFLGGKFKLIATRHAESNPSNLTLGLLRKADEVVTLTQAMSKALPIASTVIGHGIDTSFFAPAKVAGLDGVKQKSIISVIGRVREAKGQRVFMEAVAPILQSNKDWATVIVGKVDEEAFLSALQEIVKAHQIDEQVYFFEETKDILKIYQASAVVVVPSFTEGFSLVCLEAMACGCIVVATDTVGVHPELISHGQTGFLFPPGNVEALKSTLESVISTTHTVIQEQARVMAVSQWDVSKESERLTALYLK